MDYQAHYDRLITRAQGRTLVGYKEKHHILPKCLGGSNAKVNLAELTPEEHYVAHQLLVKVYPQHSVLALALQLMCDGQRRQRNNKLFGWLRRRATAATKAIQSLPENREAARVRQTGHKYDPEVGRKRGEKARGTSKPFSIDGLRKQQEQARRTHAGRKASAGELINRRAAAQARLAREKAGGIKRPKPNHTSAGIEKMRAAASRRWARERARKEENWHVS